MIMAGIEARCPGCGGTFRHKPSEPQKYCSRACYRAHLRAQAAEVTERCCTTCGVVKPLEAFYAQRHAHSLLNRSTRCIDCTRASNRARARERKRLVVQHYSGGVGCCACCGVADLAFLSIDHLDGGGTQHRASIKATENATDFYRWLIKQGYPPGYRVLCYNCNMAIGFYGECPHERERRAKEAPATD
jgi:hypothetical protein